jgi:adenylate kinase
LRSDEVRRRGFVLDGFPRTIRQADALQELLEEMDVKLDRVISLEIDPEVVVARLAGRLGCTKCGEIYHSVNKPPRREGLCDKCDTPLLNRDDDRPETVRERLRVFRENTQPVVEFYEQRSLLRRVDANQTPEAVYEDITRGLS